MLPSKNNDVDIVISDEDIEQMARIMGKDFSDPERIGAIQFLDCGDVNACPGSGKTTTMVAKLLILSKKLEGKNVGICALSHTNAAKNEIEKSLGPHSTALLRYPHFVGTLQSFFDLFLAIPAYIEEFGHRPVAIDDDLFKNIAIRSFHLINRKIRYGIVQWMGPNRENPVINTSYGFSNFDIVNFENNQESPFYCLPTTQTYAEVLRWRRELTSLGYLTYHDAFAFANRYLQKYPYLNNIISRRFSYVFIDEMQDTDSYQNELIERIFRNRSIIQRYGDPNQAIYGQRSQGGESVWQPDEAHAIRTSRRLSTSISSVSQGISYQSNTIIGNPQIPNHSPVMILFSERRKQDVIPRFGQLIEELSLHSGPFKVLGAIGRPHHDPTKLSITSYWPSFERRLQQSRSKNAFWGIINQAQASLRLNKSFAEPFLFFSKAFTELLRVQNLKSPEGYFYNSTQLLNIIRETGVENFNIYKGLILSNIERMVSGKELTPDMLIEQAKFVFSILGISMNEQVDGIIHDGSVLNIPDHGMVILGQNTYVHSPQTSIEVDTIHSAKGQTHQATLLVETYFRQNDLQCIFSYLIGQALKKPGVQIKTRFLPLAYVACTRPTHLLCLAIQRDHISTSQIEQSQKFGWCAIELN